jgi:hypothetical protein
MQLRGAAPTAHAIVGLTVNSYFSFQQPLITCGNSEQWTNYVQQTKFKTQLLPNEKR